MKANLKPSKCVLMVAIIAILVSCVHAERHAVESPDGQITASFDVKNGVLFYSVSKGGTPVVGSSNVEIFADAKMAVVDQSIRQNDTNWKPVWGQFSTIRDYHRELTLSLTADGMPVKLLCRAFDTGVGFRFVLSEESKGKEMTYASEYKVLSGAAHYAGQRGAEFSTQGKTRHGLVPLVTERKDGLYVGFLESDLYSAAGFELMRVRFVAADKSFAASSSAVSTGEGQVTSWRTILVVGFGTGAFTVTTTETSFTELIPAVTCVTSTSVQSRESNTSQWTTTGLRLPAMER